MEPPTAWPLTSVTTSPATMITCPAGIAATPGSWSTVQSGHPRCCPFDTIGAHPAAALVRLESGSPAQPRKHRAGPAHRARVGIDLEWLDGHAGRPMKPATTWREGILDTLQLTDGRVLTYDTYGDPNGRPVLFNHGFSDSRLIRNPDGALTASLGVQDNRRRSTGGRWIVTAQGSPDGRLGCRHGAVGRCAGRR